MKKGIFITLLSFILLFHFSPLSAQKYRGDGEASIGFAIPYLLDSNEKFSQKSYFEFTTAHGVQINKYFIGGGLGIMFSSLSDSQIKSGNEDIYRHIGYHQNITIPIFIKGRYDFFNSKGINPFISLKLGYIINFDDLFATVYDRNADNSYTYYCKVSGLYISPQIGVRFRTSKYTGINLGISYNLHNLRYISHNSSNHLKGFISMVLGFDF